MNTTSEDYFKAVCVKCGVNVETPNELYDSVVECPDCGEKFLARPIEIAEEKPARRLGFSPPTPIANQPVTVKIISKTEFAGIGAAIQILGLVSCFFVFPIGAVFGLILFCAGSAMSRKTACGNCRNPVANKDVRICPVCKSLLRP